jgi:hypothetical protein
LLAQLAVLQIGISAQQFVAGDLLPPRFLTTPCWQRFWLVHLTLPTRKRLNSSVSWPKSGVRPRRKKMSKDAEHDKTTNVNNVLITCLNLFGVLSTVGACLITLVFGIWGLRNPEPVQRFVDEIISGETPTVTIVEIVVAATPPPGTPTDTPTKEPTTTPYPTYTPYPTPVPATPVVKVATTTPVPTPTELANTPPDSILEVGDWWKTNNVWLRINKVEFDTVPSELLIYLDLKNLTENKLVFSWIPAQNLTVVDNTGHIYEVRSSGDWERNEVVDPSTTIQLPFPGGGSNTWSTFDTFYFNQPVTELVLTVTDLSRISFARWRIKIPK